MSERQHRPHHQARHVRRAVLRWGAGGVSVALTGSLASLGAAGCRLEGVSAAALRRPAAEDDPTESPQPSLDSPIPEADAAAWAGIQSLLERHAAARAALDRDAYLATVDQRNLVWRRIQGDVFSQLQASGYRVREAFRVTRVQPKSHGYYKAWLDIGPAAREHVERQAVWVFCPTDDGWLLSEPLNEELGSRLLAEAGHFRLAHYGWDEDILERTVSVAERAHARIEERLGVTPPQAVTLNLNPTFASHSVLRDSGIWAAFLPGVRDTVYLRSLESYGAGETAIGETQEERLLIPLTHEYTHLVNDLLVPVVKLPKWMTEGLAEWVTDDYRRDVVREALRARRTLTLEKANEVMEWGRDPSKGFTLRDISLAYGQSAYAVAYFVERLGLPAFWRLAETYADSRRWAESFSQVTGMSWEQFESDWLAWLPSRVG